MYHIEKLSSKGLQPADQKAIQTAGEEAEEVARLAELPPLTDEQLFATGAMEDRVSCFSSLRSPPDLAPTPSGASVGRGREGEP